MATIVKRDNGSYSVVYRYVDENGKTKQKWESFSDYRTAKARKAEVEGQQIKNAVNPRLLEFAAFSAFPARIELTTGA